MFFLPKKLIYYHKKEMNDRQVANSRLMRCCLTHRQLANLQEPTNWDNMSAAEDERLRWTTSWESGQSYSHYQPKPARGESSTAEQAVRWDSVGSSAPRSHFLCLCFSHCFTLCVRLWVDKLWGAWRLQQVVDTPRFLLLFISPFSQLLSCSFKHVMHLRTCAHVNFCDGWFSFH